MDPRSGPELWKAEARVTRCSVGWEEAENKVPPRSLLFPSSPPRGSGASFFLLIVLLFLLFFLFPNSSFLLSSSPVNPLLSPFLPPPAVLLVPPSPAHLCLPLHCLLVISLDLTPLPTGRWAEAETWLRVNLHAHLRCSRGHRGKAWDVQTQFPNSTFHVLSWPGPYPLGTLSWWRLALGLLGERRARKVVLFSVDAETDHPQQSGLNDRIHISRFCKIQV